MMLENCVYDFFELTTLNMAQHGLFGDILHVEGSYIHNLEEFWAPIKATGGWISMKNTGGMYMPPTAWDLPVNSSTSTGEIK